MNFKPWIRVNEIGPSNAFGDTRWRKAHGSTKTMLKKTKQLVRGIQASIKADNWPTPNYSTLVSEPYFSFHHHASFFRIDRASSSLKQCSP